MKYNTATKRTSSGKAAPSASMQGNPDRLNYIATAAYYKAEARGFMLGQELDNWLEAEAEFDEREGR